MIKIAGFAKESIVDGPGFRYTVFTQGCSHRCQGCHNPHTHDPNGGTAYEAEEIFNDVKKNPLLDGITLSGGEPFEQAEACYELADMVKKHGMSVVTYTGYTLEQLAEKAETDRWVKKLLDATDILIDGLYDEKQRSLELDFRGSANQRIIYI